MARMNPAETSIPAQTPTDGPLGFHMLAKPTGATCNLDCAYCFFLSKEMLYPGSRFRMADELLETYIRQLIEAQRVPYVAIAWQGGEPTLMGADFFRRAHAYVEKYRRPGMQVEYTIQTNGTLIDDELAAQFKEHDYLVGISIDGPPAMHDAYRVDRGGAQTSERVLRGLETLKRHGVEFNTLTTLHRANADHPREVYRYLRDEVGSRHLQFIPIIERLPAPRIDVTLDQIELSPGLAREAPWRSWRDRPLYRQAGDLVTDRSVTPDRVRRLPEHDFFDEWVRRDIGTVYVQMFDVALANWHGEPGGLCVFEPTCGGALALEHNGDVYSCDHFVEEGYQLGNITETPMAELVASPAQREFGRDKLDSLPQFCRDCDVRFACHGACPKDRFIRTPDGEPGLNYLCSGYKAFFHHVDEPMRAMSALLRQGRAPSELMAVYATRDADLRAAVTKAGRNDQCPCGSGRKVKHCHGATSASGRDGQTAVAT